jgi:predicted MFS family arabinose efflux permease
VSWHHVMANFSMMVGGSVSYGVSFIESGFAVWRIFFLVIGLLTICSGVIICLLLPDSRQYHSSLFIGPRLSCFGIFQNELL